MTRPQARAAILPVSNRANDHRPAFVSAFSNTSPAPGKSWYNIKAKKKADKVTLDVMIYDEIGMWGITAKDFVKDLMSQEADQIVVHVNSPGGDVFDGVAIYNSLRMHSAPVTVYVEGLAASAASFIAQAGDEVIMLKNSTMMIHDASALAWGDEAVMLETAEILSKISNNIADIYAQRAGGKTEAWRDIMREEMWYSAEEAVTAKLADRVDDNENEGAQNVMDSWDLSVYNFAGRESAPDPLERMLVITNKAQEAAAMVPKIDNEKETEGTEAPAAPETPVAPEAPATEPVVQPAADDPDDEGTEGTEGTETPPPAAQPVPAVPTAKAGSFIVNGVNMSDPKAVQTHITALENARDEGKKAARTEFIKNLASGPAPKIAATQIDAMEKLVATMNDEQYEMWSATWNDAVSSPLFARHGGAGGGTPSGTAAEAAADQIDVWEGTVKNHLQGGMKPEQIEATDSFKKLKAAKPEFTLESLKK